MSLARTFRLNSLIVGIGILVVVMIPSSLHAQATIQVPANYPTIQSAINAANSGDTVLVDPGTYVENINFNGKAITVTSSNGPVTTIIDGNHNGTVVTFNHSETAAAVLSGFTIRNGFRRIWRRHFRFLRLAYHLLKPDQWKSRGDRDRHL